ncbi:hypothetical protein Ancab_024751 [Ancistrocladus abbreviatus]
MISRQIQLFFPLAKSTTDLLQFYSIILKTALDHIPSVISNFIFSSSSISLQFTRRVFDELPIIPPLFAWNTIIRSYTNSSDPIESVALLSELHKNGLKPDYFTIPFVLKACGLCSVIHHGGAVHSVILKMGLACDKYICNTLLRMYAACGDIALARQVFDEMPLRDVASWSSMIAAYAASYPMNALMVLRDMKKMNEMPNSITLVSLLSACGCLLHIRVGISIHSYIIVAGIEVDVALGSALIDMYSKCGKIDKALQMFNSLGEKNLQCWTIMITGLADHGRGKDAITLFARMKQIGIKPDSMSYSAILSACSHLGIVHEGQKFFREISQVYGIKPTMQHYGCLVDMLGRAGMVKDAYEVIRSMPMKPNSVILRTFLGSSRNHGINLDEGAKRLLLGMEPELGANYVLAANMSSTSGLYDDAANLRIAMKRKRVEKVPGCSWMEMNRNMVEENVRVSTVF